MSIFKDFLDNIKAVPGSVKGIPTALKSLTGGSPYLSEEEREKERILYDNVRKGLSDTDKVLSNIPGFGLTKKGAANVGDLLLKGAVALNENVVSPYFRGISTAALLSDPNSPLYKKGEYEEGFQYKDIKAAWNRSAEVSMFQSLTKSNLVPGLTPLSKLVLSTNNIDLNEVDLWNNESIQQNFVDNAVGRWFTGFGDLVVGTAALGGAGRLATIPVKFGATKAGVYTKTKTVEQLAEDMDAGIQYAKTNGATGRQTVSGNHAVTLAESQDWGLITRMVSRYSTNDKLIPLIHEATDAGAVKDLLLADKGNVAALARLAETAPDKLFDMSDTASFLQSKYLLTGKSYVPDEVSAPRLKAAYDAAIERNPQFVKIRDAFFDPKYEMTHGGRNFMPMEPVIGRGLAISAGEKARSLKSAFAYREFGKFGDIMETTLGSGASRIAVSLVKFGTRQSEYKPLGFVTFSGVRPLDGRVELNNFLNNIRLFRDGEKMIEIAADGTKRKVADIRRDFEDMFVRSLGKNEVETLDKIDSTIGRYLAYSAKFYDEQEISAHISKYRNNINEGIEGFKKNKYGIGIDGRAILTDDPQTIRQLVESYRFTPWDSIENAFIEASGKSVGLKTRAPQVAGAFGAQIFRDLNRLWTFDVLVRPMYIIKQSIGEPIWAATWAQGATFLYNDLAYTGMTALRNGAMRIAETTSKIKNRKARNSVNKTVLAKKEEYSRISAIKDDAQASLEDLLSPNSSPATKTQHLPAAREQLKIASALLDEVELDLRSAMKPFGRVEAIPSMTTLERRLAFLAAKPELGANKQELANAKKAIANYRNTINKLTMNKKEIIDADNKVALAYKSVDKILDELGEALKDQADVWGKSAKYKKRYFAKVSQYRLLDNGEYVSIDSFTNPTSPFGTAILAETKNTKTAEINMLGEYSTGVRANLVRRKVPSDVIKISDPEYFDELAYVANRTMRGDPLIDLILNNTSMAELRRWAVSDAGIRHLRLFNITEKSQVNAYLADKVALVNRTFPSQESRLAILQREVTAQELQSMLANYTDELFDVVPNNFNYGAGNMGGVNPYKRLSNTIDAASAEVFKLLLKPENPIRRAYFEKVAADVVARKASYLASQGVDITPNQLNALRQSAGREALEELEKTFYTTRRQNRLLYAARGAVAFPNAGVNAFYRYGRIAANNPVRSVQFVSNYGRLFQSFGINENGNPTKEINEITHLIVPGTEEMGFGYMDQGTALNARSLGFILNNFTPSFIAALSVGKIMKNYPGTEEGIRKIMDSGPYKFDDIFPYGAPTSLTKQLTPPWANALYNAAVGDTGKADYLSSWNSVYNYHKTLVDLGIEKKMPSDEQILKEVNFLWSEKFISGFISPFGIPYKVETSPNRGMSNLFYRLKEKYVAQGNSEQKARDLAGDEMIALLGPNFMVDRVSFTGSSKELNLPPTYEAFKRVFEDNDELVGKLATIDKDDIGIVSLLTADLSRNENEKSTNIINILSNPDLKLPGTTKRINDFRLQPQEIERERMKQRTWNDYNLVRDALEEKITDGRSLRAHPELKAILDQLVETSFKGQSQAWYDEYQLSASGDTSYKWARAFNTIINDKKFMNNEAKDVRFWKDATLFVNARNTIALLYQSLPDYDPRKAAIRENYNQWTLQNVEQWDPTLQMYIKQYFDNDSLKAVE